MIEVTTIRSRFGRQTRKLFRTGNGTTFDTAMVAARDYVGEWCDRQRVTTPVVDVLQSVSHADFHDFQTADGRTVSICIHVF